MDTGENGAQRAWFAIKPSASVARQLPRGLASTLRVTMRFPMRSDFARLAALAFCLVELAFFAHGQSATTGALAGSVTDPSGATLPHAIVTLVNSATMATQTANTTSSGG